MSEMGKLLNNQEWVTPPRTWNEAKPNRFYILHIFTLVF